MYILEIICIVSIDLDKKLIPAYMLVIGAYF